MLKEINEYFFENSNGSQLGSSHLEVLITSIVNPECCFNPVLFTLIPKYSHFSSVYSEALQYIVVGDLVKLVASLWKKTWRLGRIWVGRICLVGWVIR